MIIWGSRGKTTDVSEGQFFCPRCQRQRQYIHKEVGKYFTLYFIPLFRTSMLGEYIECQNCFTPFEKTVLTYDHDTAETAQKFLKTIKDEIEAGLPLHVIYQGLSDEGADKDTINTVISIATNGKMKICKPCNLVYSATLHYCSSCGNSLSAIE